MDEEAYDAAVETLTSHIPEAIQGDHRGSLENRLKYGNEHSLRKRLTDMFERIPEEASHRIADDVGAFVSKVVDTRNYYTHYHHASKANALQLEHAYIAAERVRILIVANLLHDLGINDESLLNTLERSQKFRHWMSQALPF